MNTLVNQHGIAAREAIESRFARRIASHLTERAESAAPEITERLRFAREKALAGARAARTGTDVVGVGAQGTAVLGFSRSPWWPRLASLLPLAALLGDDLPINAYRDAGFAEYLKSQPGE